MLILLKPYLLVLFDNSYYIDPTYYLFLFYNQLFTIFLLNEFSKFKMRM